MTLSRARIALLGVPIAVIMVASFWHQAGSGDSGCSRATPQALSCRGGDLETFAKLISVEGHDLKRVSSRLPEGDLRPSDTLVVVDPTSRSDGDAATIRRFVERGGRAVLGHAQAEQVAGRAPTGPTHSDDSGTSFSLQVPIAEVASVNRVETSGDGSWASPGAFLPGLGDAGGALLVAGSLGSGRLLLLADLSALDNEHITRGENAALVEALVGAAGQRVVILESPLAFSAPTGFSAIPANWRWALLGLLTSAIVAMVAFGRRLGPPEHPDRELPPARVSHAVAVGGLLARTGQDGPVATSIQRRAQRVLAGSLQASWSPEQTVAEAIRRGVPASDAHALVGPINGADGLLRAGRALAQLEERRPSA